jgi:tRNA/tmRNA/rRNA uracil-C5-methylase (TrmA/RlmC/RlmD family)
VLVTADRSRHSRQHGHRQVREHAAGRRWLVRADGFWQVHPAAADTLADAVAAALAPRAGETALDLYAGVGLFAGVLGEAVGTGGAVTAVESDPGAIADARRNLRDLPWVRVVAGRVDALLGVPSEGRSRGRRAAGPNDRAVPGKADLVVLDPPRSGAGKAVVRAVALRRPRAVAYVACDPAALARDVRAFAESGYRLDAIRAFDAFPMTHHVECVATLRPSTSR